MAHALRLAARGQGRVWPWPSAELSKLCVKSAVSPAAMLPMVMPGVADDSVVPSYSLVSVTAVTVMARVLMLAVKPVG